MQKTHILSIFSAVLFIAIFVAGVQLSGLSANGDSLTGSVTGSVLNATADDPQNIVFTFEQTAAGAFSFSGFRFTESPLSNDPHADEYEAWLLGRDGELETPRSFYVDHEVHEEEFKDDGTISSNFRKIDKVRVDVGFAWDNAITGVQIRDTKRGLVVFSQDITNYLTALRRNRDDDPPPSAPIQRITLERTPLTGTAPLTVTFTAHLYNLPGCIASSWSFGAGETGQSANPSCRGDYTIAQINGPSRTVVGNPIVPERTVTTTYRYAKAGIYTVTYTAGGLSKSIILSIPGGK